ncbi:hypothetical protein BC567DRAFT_217719 [Phyllosticta citribraziliensis]
MISASKSSLAARPIPLHFSRIPSLLLLSTTCAINSMNIPPHIALIGLFLPARHHRSSIATLSTPPSLPHWIELIYFSGVVRVSSWSLHCRLQPPSRLPTLRITAYKPLLACSVCGTPNFSRRIFRPLQKLEPAQRQVFIISASHSLYQQSTIRSYGLVV